MTTCLVGKRPVGHAAVFVGPRYRARPSMLLASDTTWSSVSSAQRPNVSSSSRTTPASATGRRPLREGSTDRGGLLLQHRCPHTLARHHDRERHLHHLLGGHPADPPNDLGIGRGTQGLACPCQDGMRIVMEPGCHRC